MSYFIIPTRLSTESMPKIEYNLITGAYWRESSKKLQCCDVGGGGGRCCSCLSTIYSTQECMRGGGALCVGGGRGDFRGGGTQVLPVACELRAQLAARWRHDKGALLLNFVEDYLRNAISFFSQWCNKMGTF